MEEVKEAPIKKDEFPEEAYREFNVDENLRETYEKLASPQDIRQFLKNHDIEAESTVVLGRPNEGERLNYQHSLKNKGVRKDIEPGIGDEAKTNPLGVTYKFDFPSNSPSHMAEYFVSSDGNEAFTYGSIRDQLRTDIIDNGYPSAEKNREMLGSRNAMNIEAAKNPKSKGIESLIKAINPDTKLFD